MGAMANARGFAADNRTRVFVSHARADTGFADQIGAFLHNAGFQPLLDRYESGGEGWEDRIGRLIEDSDALVLVLTEASANSEMCVWEVEEAQRLSKRVVLVRPQPLRGVAPPVERVRAAFAASLSRAACASSRASASASWAARLPRISCALTRSMGFS